MDLPDPGKWFRVALGGFFIVFVNERVSTPVCEYASNKVVWSGSSIRAEDIINGLDNVVGNLDRKIPHVPIIIVSDKGQLIVVSDRGQLSEAGWFGIHLSC